MTGLLNARLFESTVSYSTCRPPGQACAGAMEVTGQDADVFLCAGTLKDGKVAAAPKKLTVAGGAEQPGVAKSEDVQAKGTDDVSLKTLDIFAGAQLSTAIHDPCRLACCCKFVA